jgi:hypothetical protein
MVRANLKAKEPSHLLKGGNHVGNRVSHMEPLQLLLISLALLLIHCLYRPTQPPLLPTAAHIRGGFRARAAT